MTNWIYTIWTYILEFPNRSGKNDELHIVIYYSEPVSTYSTGVYLSLLITISEYIFPKVSQIIAQLVSTLLRNWKPGSSRVFKVFLHKFFKNNSKFNSRNGSRIKVYVNDCFSDAQERFSRLKVDWK